MRALLFLLIIGGLITLPFSLIKRPWAVRMWKRIRMGLVLYMLVILASAIFTLVTKWDRIYG